MEKKSFFMLTIIILGITTLLRNTFGGKGNTEKNDTIQNSGTGFVGELKNNGKTDDTQYSQTNQNSNNKKPNEIRIMMPRYFYNSAWENFSNDLYSNKKIYIKFILIDNLNDYKNQISNNKFSESDLFLFPYDWINKIPTISFSIQDEINYKFDQSIEPLINGEQFSFLPFAVDPIIMYTIPGYGTKNFYEISEFVSNRKTEIPLSFPLFFGIVSEDFDNKGFSREYQDIVRYALMHYFTNNNDDNNLGIRIDSNATQKYNTENLNTILNIINTPECEYFPSICFQVYKFVGLRFGFLSDIDIVNTYFSGKKTNFEILSKTSLPFSELESPIRIRGRGMPISLEDTNTINCINEFIEELLNNYDKYDLRNSSLSVFKLKNNGVRLYDNQYIGLKGYILTNGGDYINTLRSINKFRDLIKYKITAKEYLN